MEAPDGKMRLTDVADTEQLFRLIQSIPSPKAEPFKETKGSNFPQQRRTTNQVFVLQKTFQINYPKILFV